MQKNKFYLKYFFPIIDQSIVSINERIQQEALYDIHKITSVDFGIIAWIYRYY